jgi:hypothetical protein
MQPFDPQATPQLHGTNPGAAAVGHETKDVNVKAVLGFLLALAVSGLAIFAICLGIYKAFDHWATVHDGPPTTWNVEQDREEAQTSQQLAKQGANKTQVEQAQYESRVERFPQPRLQTDDTRDMQMLREQEDLQLDNYMWVDQNAGKVVIPIDRAIELTAQRGLPTTPNAQEPTDITPPYTIGVARVEAVSSHNPKRK